MTRTPGPAFLESRAFLLARIWPCREPATDNSAGRGGGNPSTTDLPTSR
ncbi:MAG: hypothetical protein KF753_06195 [Caldilineaceae bacterium]|nr:hypothetical protein [Caldilineaceae bacterium]